MNFLLTIIGRLGGDSKLTPRGEEFAKKLGDYVNQLQHPNFKVWTSWLTRTIDTAEYIDFQQERLGPEALVTPMSLRNLYRNAPLKVT